MNIYILSVSPNIYSTDRIVEEALYRGHSVRVVNHLKCSIQIGQGKSKIIYKGEDITNAPDVIIPRIGASATRHGSAVVRQFEMNNVVSTASSQGIIDSQNKANSLQRFSFCGLPIPNTLFSVDSENISEQISALSGTPLIIKVQEGTQGMGVMLADSDRSAKSIIDAMYSMNKSVLLQEFIKESKAEDIRVIVTGKKVVAAMKRKGVEGDFRSNIHQGGSGFRVDLTDKEVEIAIKAAESLDLEVAGVDIIRSERGPLLLEVNSTPGLQGIEYHTDDNVAEKIIKYIEYKCSKEILKTK